jgi:hypothetical protein
LSRDHPLANCALTTYEIGADQRLTLELDGWTAPLEMEEVPVTEEHDAHVKPR